MGAARGNHGLQDDEKSKKNTPGIIKINPRTYLLIYIYMLTVHSAEAAEVAPWKLRRTTRGVRVAKLADASCLVWPNRKSQCYKKHKNRIPIPIKRIHPGHGSGLCPPSQSPRIARGKGILAGVYHGNR